MISKSNGLVGSWVIAYMMIIMKIAAKNLHLGAVQA